MGGSFFKITIYVKTFVLSNSRVDELDVRLSEFNKWDGCNVRVLDQFNIAITKPTNLRNPTFNEPSISDNMLNPYRINLSRDNPLILSFQPTGIINLVKACGTSVPSLGQQGLVLTYMTTIVINADESPNALSDNKMSWYYINQHLTPTSINTRTRNNGSLNYNYKDSSLLNISRVSLVPVSLSPNTSILDITINPDLSVIFDNTRCPNVTNVLCKNNTLEVTCYVDVGRISCITNITSSSLTVPSMLSIAITKTNNKTLLLHFISRGNNIAFVDNDIASKFVAISDLVQDGPLSMSLLIYALP